jgi:4'-phosphopantetheinyl transferase
VTQYLTTLAALETEAHVFLARPDDILDDGEGVRDAKGEREFDRYLELLSQLERDRQARFRFAEHRKLFLVSHVLVRTTLSRYADVAPDQWQFSQGEFGRPEVSGPEEALRLRFNLSHTEGLAACVICRDIDCGVDVERMNRVKDLGGVARRVLTASERDDLSRREGDSLGGRFTEYWTLKEAYMKARGKGFQLPPHTFTIRIGEGDEPELKLELTPECDDRAEEWQLALCRLPPAQKPGYRLGLALRTGSAGPRRIIVRDTILS